MPKEISTGVTVTLIEAHEFPYTVRGVLDHIGYASEQYRRAADAYWIAVINHTGPDALAAAKVRLLSAMPVAEEAYARWARHCAEYPEQWEE